MRGTIGIEQIAGIDPTGSFPDPALLLRPGRSCGRRDRSPAIGDIDFGIGLDIEDPGWGRLIPEPGPEQSQVVVDGMPNKGTCRTWPLRAPRVVSHSVGIPSSQVVAVVFPPLSFRMNLSRPGITMREKEEATRVVPTRAAARCAQFGARYWYPMSVESPTRRKVECGGAGLEPWCRTLGVGIAERTSEDDFGLWPHRDPPRIVE